MQIMRVCTMSGDVKSPPASHVSMHTPAGGGILLQTHLGMARHGKGDWDHSGGAAWAMGRCHGEGAEGRPKHFALRIKEGAEHPGHCKRQMPCFVMRPCRRPKITRDIKATETNKQTAQQQREMSDQVHCRLIAPLACNVYLTVPCGADALAELHQFEGREQTYLQASRRSTSLRGPSPRRGDVSSEYV